MKNKKAGMFISLFASGIVSLAGIASAEEPAGSLSFWEKTKVTGGIDVNYNYSFNRPTTTVAGPATNGYRAFDSNANSFNISNVEIAIESAPTDWVTFRTDLDFGRDPKLVNGTENWAAGEIFNLQQAYVALKAPVGNGLTFKIGKFVTMHGNEVLEGWANNNISRSLLFNYAIPFTHTGIMANYAFTDWLTVDLGVVNGWNSVVDINNGKSVHAQFTIKPFDKLTWIIGGTVGPETAGADGPIRALVDTTLTYVPTDKWTLAINYDWGRDSALAGHGGFADWQGVAGYVHWVPIDWFGLSFRGEFYKDDVGTLGVPTGAVASTKVFEGTLTSHFYVSDGLDLRLEYRHDHGNNASFLRGNGASRRFQDTVAAQVVYAF